VPAGKIRGTDKQCIQTFGCARQAAGIDLEVADGSLQCDQVTLGGSFASPDQARDEDSCGHEEEAQNTCDRQDWHHESGGSRWGFGAGVMEGRGRLGRHEWEGFGLSDGREVVEGEDFHMGGLAMLVYWYRERAKKFRLPRRCWGEEKVLAADEHG